MNAIIHAFDNGKTSGELTFILAVEDSDMLMTVRDDGKGMPEEVATKIFDPFAFECILESLSPVKYGTV